MPRTRRYIFNTLTVVSLLLMLGTVWLWVDSYWYVTEIMIPIPDVLEFESMNGKLSVHAPAISTDLSMVGLEANLDASRVPHLQKDEFDRTLNWSSLGFENMTTIFATQIYVIPHWFLVLVFAIVPAIWLFKRNKRRKLGPNTCPSCGYDLTGNETGECPECGACTAEVVSQST